MTRESLCGVQDRCGQCPVIKYRQEVIEKKEARIVRSVKKGMLMLDEADVAVSDNARAIANARAQYMATEVTTNESAIPRIQGEIVDLSLNCDGPVGERNLVTFGRVVYRCDSRSIKRRLYEKIPLLRALYAEVKVTYKMRKATNK